MLIKICTTQKLKTSWSRKLMSSINMIDMPWELLKIDWLSDTFHVKYHFIFFKVIPRSVNWCKLLYLATRLLPSVSHASCGRNQRLLKKLGAACFSSFSDQFLQAQAALSRPIREKASTVTMNAPRAGSTAEPGAWQVEQTASADREKHKPVGKTPVSQTSTAPDAAWSPGGRRNHSPRQRRLPQR